MFKFQIYVYINILICSNVLVISVYMYVLPTIILFKTKCFFLFVIVIKFSSYLFYLSTETILIILDHGCIKVEVRNFVIDKCNYTLQNTYNQCNLKLKLNIQVMYLILVNWVTPIIIPVICLPLVTKDREEHIEDWNVPEVATSSYKIPINDSTFFSI